MPGRGRAFSQAIQLAGATLETILKELRDISTTSVSLSEPTFEAIRERIADMRKEVLEIARNDENIIAVYQINFQVFPVTRSIKSEVGQ